MELDKYVRASDFDQFNGTLISRVMEKDYVGLERDLDRIVKKKIEAKMDAAREDWRRMCKKGADE